ncbi:MAG: hypothetical protein FWD32_00040 [Firmicutes bacterium]|nr:hypothetical protein [Bacillota bacterium]
MIKSYSFNQQEILNNILKLYNKGSPFHLDPCYNKGGFYKNGVVKVPVLKGDIKPLSPGVLKLDVCNLTFNTGSIKSAIFDPPFIVSCGSYKMAQRYGFFKTVSNLKNFYSSALFSLQRVLKHGGLLVFKYQDFINGRQPYNVTQFILNKAQELNFAYRDLFVCLNDNVIISQQSQNHARKCHTYFLVLKCNKRQDKKSIYL